MGPAPIHGRKYIHGFHWGYFTPTSGVSNSKDDHFFDMGFDADHCDCCA